MEESSSVLFGVKNRNIRAVFYVETKVFNLTFRKATGSCMSQNLLTLLKVSRLPKKVFFSSKLTNSAETSDEIKSYGLVNLTDIQLSIHSN